MNVEQEINRLSAELDALKATYEAASSTLPVTTKTLQYVTKENRIKIRLDGVDSEFDYDERVVVTLTAPSGANTIAKLEIQTDGEILPSVRRVPFNGGARWIVTAPPRMDYASFNWTPTHYVFAVQTLVNGTLDAKMVWE